MKFIINRASTLISKNIQPCPLAVFNSTINEWEIEIDQLQGLIDLIKDLKESLVIDYDPLEIIIYDGYLE